jgi:hypothetical protein
LADQEDRGISDGLGVKEAVMSVNHAVLESFWKRFTALGEHVDVGILDDKV